MEEKNQKNLISYIISSLSSLESSVRSRNSFWQDNNSFNLLIFLNNSLYWSGKTRTVLYTYLQENKADTEAMISAVHKGMRDAFMNLLFSPFDNYYWEYIWSKYYVFCSFLQGLCKENCQEFKKFLGVFKSDLGCELHRSKQLSVMDDLQ